MPLAVIAAALLFISAPASPLKATGTFLIQTPQQDTKPASNPQDPTKPNAEPEAPAPDNSKPKQQTPPPAPAQAPDTNEPQQATTPEANSPATTKPESKAKPKVTLHKKKKRKRAAKAGDGPTKVIVRHGSTADPELEFVPSLSREQASRQLQYTNQLLSGTEANLKTASARQLKPGEQDQIKQIHTYMDQAKAAANAGDVQRAQNLAYKARLLSNELVRR